MTTIEIPKRKEHVWEPKIEEGMQKCINCGVMRRISVNERYYPSECPKELTSFSEVWEPKVALEPQEPA